MKIESNVPLPYSGGGNYKYPWDVMAVGDSFLIPGKKISNVSSVANRAAARMGYKFSCRTVPGGVRVWRVG